MLFIFHTFPFLTGGPIFRWGWRISDDNAYQNGHVQKVRGWSSFSWLLRCRFVSLRKGQVASEFWLDLQELQHIQFNMNFSRSIRQEGTERPHCTNQILHPGVSHHAFKCGSWIWACYMSPSCCITNRSVACKCFFVSLLCFYSLALVCICNPKPGGPALPKTQKLCSYCFPIV